MERDEKGRMGVGDAKLGSDSGSTSFGALSRESEGRIPGEERETTDSDGGPATDGIGRARGPGAAGSDSSRSRRGGGPGGLGNSGTSPD